MICTGTNTSMISRHRRAFTLVEVLMAAVVLAIGLIGLAAVFPVVITQQREAVDKSQAITAAASADALLSTRLADFAKTLSRLPEEYEGTWMRINAYEPADDEGTYLRMPSKPIDLRLRIVERGYRPVSGQLNGGQVDFREQLPNLPIPEPTYREPDVLSIEIVKRNPPSIYRLEPDPQQITRFRTEGFGGSINASPNQIDYNNGRLDFNVPLQGGQLLEKVLIDYVWLEDRLISHRDRMYPADNPRYAWEVAIRKNYSGIPQYCLFVYRFDGPLNDTEFRPEVPKSEGSNTTGMLRRAEFTVVYDRNRKRYFIEEPTGKQQKDAIQAGAYLLPVEGSSPVQVLRRVEGVGWELDGPPLIVDADGTIRDPRATEPYWFLPASIYDGEQQVTWKITPILAYTKQVELN